MADPVTIGVSLAIMAASTIISYLLTPPPPDQEGPRQDDLSRTTSAYGKFRPITYGIVSNAGNIFDASVVYETENTEKQGGKGGKSSTLTTYTYQQDIALGLGVGIIDAVFQIFANEELIFDINGTVVKPSWLDFTFYNGSEDQMPDPTLQAIHGVGDTPAYRGEAYIVFRRFNISAFGNRIPNFRVITLSDATSEAYESTVQCNPDFDTVSDTLLTAAAMHPLTGYMVHGWGWGVLQQGAGRENPVGTVTDPYTGQYMFSLNSPQAFGEMSYMWPSFGTIPKYDYGIQTNGDYENILLAGLQFDGPNNPVDFFIYSAYSDVLEASGTLSGSNDDQVNCYYTMGSIYSDQFVIYGYKYTDFGANGVFIRRWNIDQSGLIGYEDAPFYQSDDWRTSNVGVTTNQQGDILIYSEILPGARQVLVKYTDGEAVKWTIDVPAVFTGTTSLTNAVYDKTTDSWWTIYNGNIWNFRNDTGATIGAVIDISGNPNYVNMYTKPSFSTDTRKLYWVSSDVGGDTPGSYDTITGEVLNYPVRSYESIPSSLLAAHNAYYFYPTNALFYSSTATTREAPSRRFRLQSLVGNSIALSSVIADICEKCGISPANYDVSAVSAVLIEGYRISNYTTGRANISPLLHGYIVNMIDSGGILKFLQKGTPVYPIPLGLSDLGASTTVGSPSRVIEVHRVMEAQLPSVADITYMNPDSNFEMGAQHTNRGASANTNGLKLDLPIVFKDTPAKRLINVLLHLTHIERESYELKAMPGWIFLEGGDVIDVVVPDFTQRMQIVETAFVKGVFEISAVRVEEGLLESYLEGDSAPEKDDTVAFPGTMLTALLDIPLLRDTDDNAGFYGAATAYVPSWKGGILFKSPDNTSWNVGSTFVSASIYGTTNDVLPAPVDPWQWDLLNTITVQVISGELESVTEEQALQGFNSVAYGRDGRWEVINYVNAAPDLVAENVFHLSKLLRGRLGTDHNVNNHLPSDVFIPLKISNLQYVGNELADLNVIRYYRGVSFDVNLYEKSNVTEPFVNNGVCITPLSPQQIDGTRNSALDLTITWMPRSRYPASNFWSGVASESDDLYDIEIYTSGETVPVHTVVGNTGRSYIWTRVDQLAETDGITQVVDISVWHKSQRLLSIGESGRGYEGTGRSIIGITGGAAYHTAVDALPSTLFHFRFDMEEPPDVDGLPCVDTKGAVTTATYEEFSNLAFVNTIVPSNIPDPLDTSMIGATTSDRVEVPIGDANLCNTGKTFSISLIANIINDNTLFLRQNHFQFSMLTNGWVRFNVWGPEGIQYVQITTDMRDSKTKHFVFTADLTSGVAVMKIHVNGALLSGNITGVDITDINQPVDQPLTITPTSIYLDDFVFHNEALTDIQIAYLYSNTGL